MHWPASASDANLSKTKVVIFEARKSDCKEFVFIGTTVERHDDHRYLVFVFHATKNMAYGVKYLVGLQKRQCMPCDGFGCPYVCLILLPYESCLECYPF